MKILVTGGTGAVGSLVVRELLARKVEVKVLTRDRSRAEKLPPGVTPIIGDLEDPTPLRAEFADIDGLFLLIANSVSETHQGLLTVELARICGVKHIVYLSVHKPEQAKYVPHVGSKWLIETIIKDSGIPFTILRPNVFMQNDYWFKDVLLERGIYPQPIGDAGVSTVDVRDIAEAAAIAFTASGHVGKTYNLVGPDVVTGESVAKLWSRALHKDIKYGGHDMVAWELGQRESVPGWFVSDLRIMYESFQKQNLAGTAFDTAQLTALLGHPPRTYENFTLDAATKWRLNGG